MKLTKAQRLFISVGKIEYEITLQKNSCCPWDDDRAEGALIIKKLNTRRKKLIREALKEWRDDADNLFLDGYQTCFKRTKEWELYRTEHT